MHVDSTPQFCVLQGDASLPAGLVTFVVGAEKHLVEHVSKPILSVRTEYFRSMFRGIMCEHEAERIIVPDATAAAFETLIDYIISDQVEIDTTTGHAFEVMQLARKYPRPNPADLALHIVVALMPVHYKPQTDCSL